MIHKGWQPIIKVPAFSKADSSEPTLPTPSVCAQHLRGEVLAYCWRHCLSLKT